MTKPALHKTTVEISPILLREAKIFSKKTRQSLRALIEKGLREVLSKSRGQRRRFVLRDCSVAKGRMNPEFEEGGWSKIRKEIYKK